MAVFTGMRAGELGGLRWDDVDFDKRLVTVQRSFDGPTKAGDVRYVPILDALLPVLRAWRLRCGGGFVFIEETLAKYPRLRASRLWGMVVARGYKGSKSGFRAIVSRLRPRRAAEAYIRRAVLPGEEAQVDWAHFGKITVGRAERPLFAFVMVLALGQASVDPVLVRFARPRRLGRLHGLVPFFVSGQFSGHGTGRDDNRAILWCSPHKEHRHVQAHQALYRSVAAQINSTS
jgi:hypothetical protein